MSQDRIRQLQLELEQEQIKLDAQWQAEIQVWYKNPENLREYINRYLGNKILHFDGIRNNKIRFSTRLDIREHTPYYQTYGVYVYVPIDHRVLQTPDPTIHIKQIMVSDVIEELKWNFISEGYNDDSYF